jgi:hypothetical protein
VWSSFILKSLPPAEGPATSPFDAIAFGGSSRRQRRPRGDTSDMSWLPELDEELFHRLAMGLLRPPWSSP